MWRARTGGQPRAGRDKARADGAAGGGWRAVRARRINRRDCTTIKTETNEAMQLRSSKAQRHARTTRLAPEARRVRGCNSWGTK